MIENGSLSYEEETEGYIIRDEEILNGNGSTNGLTQIVTEGTRVAANEPVFRYYSSNEDEITKKIEEIDKQIDEALSQEENKQYSSFPDIIEIESEIKLELEKMLKENNIQNVREYKKRIDNYIVKKSEIAGNLSPEGSYIRSLVEQRTALSNELIRKF